MDDFRQHATKIIAHRGFCERHTENTIPALRAAAAAGAEMIEMDVHETRDGRFIVHHDSSLNHHTPPFRHLTYEQIQRLTENDDRCPLLSSCLAAIGSMPVDLEIKSCENVRNFSVELEKSPPSPGSVVSSFDLRLLGNLYAQGINLPILLLVTVSIRQELNRNIRSAFLCVFPKTLPAFLHGVVLDRRIAYKRLIRRLRFYGSTVFVWTVNAPAEIEKFISWKVDGIITDCPDRMRKLLNTEFTKKPAQRQLYRFLR